MQWSLMVADTGRFPQPDFSGGYESPATMLPPPSVWTSAETDVVILAAALLLAAWLVLRVRSRRWIRVAGLLALVWFGFVRRGCLCPMGPVQGIVAALAGVSNAGLTFSAVLLCLLPLAAALLFGRVYCAAVCPHGALQDALMVKPLRVPPWLDALLRFGRWLFFGAVVLFAATGAGWLLCRFDPYVVFFRRAGPAAAVVAGVAFLAVGAFVARPYCRYMCPYGLLLGLLARVSWRSAEITPRTCVRCRLCERSCPVDAIEPPETPPEDLAVRAATRRKLAWALGLTLPMVVAGAAAGHAWAPRLARLHPDVARASLAERAAHGERFADAADLELLDAIEAEGSAAGELEGLADVVRNRFGRVAPLVGGMLALGAMLRLVHLLRFRRSEAYDIEPADCVACGRCFVACPLNRPHVATGSPPPETGER